MDIFKNGCRTYVVLSKALTRAQALTKANEHFKAKVTQLEIQSGKMIDDETIKLGKTGTFWVVSRKWLL